MALLLASSFVRPAELTVAGETDIKAAMLFNFAYFVQWGSIAPEPVVICVANDRRMRRSLEDLTVSRGQQKRIRVLDVAVRGETASCDVVYVVGEDAADQKTVLDAVAGRRVLTVGDSRRFAERGGAVGFFIEQNRVRFAVNLGSLQAAGIGLSSKVLSLAAIVRSEDAEGGVR
jgi:hypothetical protein